MTGKELFREIGMIDEKYIVEAESTKRSIIHNVVFRRSLATAACLMVCVGLYFGTRSLSNESADMSNSTAGVSYPQEEKIMADIEVAQDVAPESAIETNEVTDGKTATESLSADADKTGTESDSTANIDSEQLEMKEDTVNEQESLGANATLGSSENLQKRLDSYPTVYEELCQTKAFVVMNGEVRSGQEQLADFVEAVENAKSSYVDIVQFTAEGNPIVTCIEYTGNLFRVTIDNTRDSDVVNNTQLVQESYQYMHIIQVDDMTKVVVSDEKNLTAEKLQSEEYRNYVVVEYQEAN